MVDSLPKYRKWHNKHLSLPLVLVKYIYIYIKCIMAVITGISPDGAK